MSYSSIDGLEFSPDLARILAAQADRGVAERLSRQHDESWRMARHGDLGRWQAALTALPEIMADDTRLDATAVAVESSESFEPTVQETLVKNLRELMPWRKGPFNFFGIDIDAEWRSDQKWKRVAPRIKPLEGRCVLDVGCGNGYYMWRMLGQRAACVLGVEPNLLHCLQFAAFRRYAVGARGECPLAVMPVSFEALAETGPVFDTVFSMGVLYHRRSPLDHLLQLQSRLRSGGELVLESLVIQGDGQQCLLPTDRYANMRNVWFIPSAVLLAGMLQRLGFTNIRTVAETPTLSSEQRRTSWMTYESLESGLDPEDSNCTREGYPAPRRAILIAERK